jgi:hypothetical protein
MKRSDKVKHMKKLFIRTLTIPAFFIIVTSNMHPAGASPLDLPFHVGEKITFEVRWSYILAGEATLELLPATKIDGQDSYHILLTASTSEFADIFYKVRDDIESYIDMNVDHSLMYIQIHHARSGRDTRVDFDWEKKQAMYSRIGSDKKAVPISVPEGTFDPLSVFYAFRLCNLKEREEISIPVTDGKKVIAGKAYVVKREVIQIGEVKYDTFLVEPELGEIGGVFEKSKDAKLQIWVTADNRHVPVRIKSKVAVGSFVAEMTSYDEGDGNGKTIFKHEQSINPSQ